ncbi:MAG: sporulation integral membrane protein YlbJ [Clostridia bacterium]|nr:sporulation integral membrane protein YlbJ [Clostridia bacterium]
MIKDLPLSNYAELEHTPNKNKIKIWVCSLKQNGITILFCLFVICLVLFSRTNLSAAKNGLILWATAVVPSLFPFFVATEMLSYTNVVSCLGKSLTSIMRPLFGVPGEAAFAFIMGLISGYPVGAKIVSNFMEQGICSKEEAERMLAFTNNSGPLFIVGTVGITLFGNTTIGTLLLITHILACISVGIILNICTCHKRKNEFIPSHTSIGKNHNKKQDNKATPPTFSSLGEILGNSIKNATSTILLIGGFVVLFSVIISILNQSHLLDSFSNICSPIFTTFKAPSEFCKPLLSGIVELTNGVSLIAGIPTKDISISIIFSAFLLGFGGFSVLLQVFSIVSKNGISIKKYAYGKLLQGFLAALYTGLAIQFIPFLQFNL